MNRDTETVPAHHETPDVAELRRLYEAAMCVGANEMAWDEWTTAISEAADALLDAAAERDALAADADKWQRAALTLQGDRDALTDERDSLSWQVEALRAERDARSSERDALAAKVERVRALHGPRVVQVLGATCSAEECYHEDACPLVDYTVCGHCYDVGDGAHPYAYEEGGLQDVAHPCATYRALDATPETGCES